MGEKEKEKERHSSPDVTVMDGWIGRVPVCELSLFDMIQSVCQCRC